MDALVSPVAKPPKRKKNKKPAVNSQAPAVAGSRIVEQQSKYSPVQPKLNIKTETLQLLEKDDVIFVADKQRSSKLSKAVFRCKVCSAHFESTESAIAHISHLRHKKNREDENLRIFLLNLPTQSPAHLDSLNSFFDTELQKIFIPEEELARRRSVADRLKCAIEKDIPESTVTAFGSTVTGLALPSSDVNLDAEAPATEVLGSPGCLLRKIAACLQQRAAEQGDVCDFHSVVVNLNLGNCVECRDSAGVPYRISIHNQSSVHTTRLIKLYLDMDERARRLAMLIRSFGHAAFIDDPQQGMLPGCVFPILAIFYLQHAVPPLLPNLCTIAQQLQASLPKDCITQAEIKAADSSQTTCYLSDLSRVPVHLLPAAGVGGSLAELWLGMLRFFLFEFKKGDYAVSISSSFPLRKFTSNFVTKRLVVVDPMLHKRNLCRSVGGSEAFEFIVDQLRAAYVYFGVPRLASTGQPFFTQLELVNPAELRSVTLMPRIFIGRDTAFSPNLDAIRGEISKEFSTSLIRMVELAAAASNAVSTVGVSLTSLMPTLIRRIAEQLFEDKDVKVLMDHIDLNSVDQYQLSFAEITDCLQLCSHIAYEIWEEFCKTCADPESRRMDVNTARKKFNGALHQTVCGWINKNDTYGPSEKGEECRGGELEHAHNSTAPPGFSPMPDESVEVCAGPGRSSVGELVQPGLTPESAVATDTSGTPVDDAEQHKLGSEITNEGASLHREDSGRESPTATDEQEILESLLSTEVGDGALLRVSESVDNEEGDAVGAGAVEMDLEEVELEEITPGNEEEGDSVLRDNVEDDEEEDLKLAPEPPSPAPASTTSTTRSLSTLPSPAAKSKDPWAVAIHKVVNIKIVVDSSLPGYYNEKQVRSLTPALLRFEFGPSMLAHRERPKSECGLCGAPNHQRDQCSAEEPDLRPCQALGPVSSGHLAILNGMLAALANQLAERSIKIQDREKVRRILSQHIIPGFPGAELRLFGSCENGFGSHSSDVDVCLVVPPDLQWNPEECVRFVTKVLNRDKNFSLQPILHAKVPIVKFFYRPIRIEGDISFNNMLALNNTRMLRLYSELDMRVRPLGIALKALAKLCNIGDASRGSLSSYAYILLLIHYLQQRKVLPVLQQLYEGKRPDLVIDGWDAWYQCDTNLIRRLFNSQQNTESLAELWLGFFRYYLLEFRRGDQVVTIRQHEPLTKIDKLWNTQLAIEDPFDLKHNLGVGLSRKMLSYILTIFSRVLYYHSIECPPNMSERAIEIFFNADLLTSRDGPPRDRCCRNCGHIGHIAKDCPRPTIPQERQHRASVGSPNDAVVPGLAAASVAAKDPRFRPHFVTLSTSPKPGSAAAQQQLLHVVPLLGAPAAPLVTTKQKVDPGTANKQRQQQQQHEFSVVPVIIDVPNHGVLVLPLVAHPSVEVMRSYTEQQLGQAVPLPYKELFNALGINPDVSPLHNYPIQSPTTLPNGTPPTPSSFPKHQPFVNLNALFSGQRGAASQEAIPGYPSWPAGQPQPQFPGGGYPGGVGATSPTDLKQLIMQGIGGAVVKEEVRMDQGFVFFNSSQPARTPGPAQIQAHPGAPTSAQRIAPGMTPSSAGSHHQQQPARSNWRHNQQQQQVAGSGNNPPPGLSPLINHQTPWIGQQQQPQRGHNTHQQQQHRGAGAGGTPNQFSGSNQRQRNNPESRRH